MVTQEEREEIIEATIERILLRLPEVVGNLMTNHAALFKLNKKFYEEYEEFVTHKDIVAKVIEEIDGSHIGMPYEDILKKAVPVIRQRIAVVSSLDTTRIAPKEELNLTYDGQKSNSHGEI